MIGTPEQLSAFLWSLDPAKRYEIKEYREKRSLKANAYFHRLVGLLARGQEERFYTIKNELIRQYGNHQLIRDAEGKPAYEILPDTEAWKWHETKHYVPTQYTEDFHGVPVRAFCLLRGTHEYDSADMAHLIECTRNECVGCGIEMDEIETPGEKALFERLETEATKCTDQ